MELSDTLSHLILRKRVIVQTGEAAAQGGSRFHVAPATMSKSANR